MKLKDTVTNEEVTLPNDLLWQDEFNWTPIRATNTYTLSGALVIEQGKRLAGRPISLEAPQPDMAWVSRGLAQTLKEWSERLNRRFLLTFEYPTDTRQFLVVFDCSTEPIGAETVRGFASHASDHEFRISLKFIEVPV